MRILQAGVKWSFLALWLLALAYAGASFLGR